MILECLEKVLRSQHLSAEEASKLMEEILSGEATSTQTSAFLVALAMKGETEEELLGMARVLRGKAYLFSQYGPVEVGLANTERRMLTVAGTAAAEAPGESPQEAVEPGSTFNIASAVAFVVAGAGVRVLQQGHRASGNKLEGGNEPTGGSDLESAAVIESLGINTRLPAWKIAQCLAEVGLGFVYEPVISQAMEQILFAFREIPVPTAFNLLLPMLNPGGAPALALGVHSAAVVETVARVLARMSVRRAFVFHGSDGLDEITNTGPTLIAEVNDGKIETRRIEPGDFGIAACRVEDLAGGDARRSADIIEAILEGEQGPRRNVVLLNAAPGIVCGGKARDLAEGVRLAGESIDSGRARAVLRRLAHFSH